MKRCSYPITLSLLIILIVLSLSLVIYIELLCYSITTASLHISPIVFLLAIVLLIVAISLGTIHMFKLKRTEKSLLVLYSQKDSLFETEKPIYTGKIDKSIREIIVALQRYSNKHLLSEYLRKEAELSALQSQINPHFLFNTLESIRGFALKNGVSTIASMTEALSRMIRNSLQKIDTLVPVRYELETIDNYMTIQNFRFSNRFILEKDIGPDPTILDLKIPILAIQPVIENAIFHGLESRTEGGMLNLSLYSTRQRLVIRVIDNGCGIKQKKLEELNQRLEDNMTFSASSSNDSKHQGIGLVNINSRIKLQFGAEYGLFIQSTYNYGTEVEITLPIIY